ncbi:unnamed protein product [Aphanomyces euteiches]
MIKPSPSEPHIPVFVAMSKLSLHFVLNHTDTQFDSPASTDTVELDSQSSEKTVQHQCQHQGCERLVVSRRACIRHGGGPRCMVPNCLSGAKTGGRCWKHGGSKQCTVGGCPNRSKARGLCWAHGGGKPCNMENCVKTALLRGLCWAHGGGKRCSVEGCKRPGYERNGNRCDRHCL